MKFLIVTIAPTLFKKGEYFSYGPYVKEMNIWAKKVEHVAICSPVEYEKELLLDKFNFKIKQFKLKPFEITSFLSVVKCIYIIPYNLLVISRAMIWTNHIHLRCPGNIGLLGCFVQIFFPNKPKTAKYAGNWDPKSKQPFTYRLQKKILSNTFLTKKMKVLVYGNWPKQTKNIYPFFTASYKKNEIEVLNEKKILSTLKLIFVGGLTEGKQPLLSVKTTHKLLKKGYDVTLDIYGDGVKRNELEDYINKHKLEKKIILHGNKEKEVVKEAFQQAHFLIFVSKSEGWPKVVAEAMFWGCLPITSKVSCVPYMLGNNTRGQVVESRVTNIVSAIEKYCKDKEMYSNHQQNAKNWSQSYTLDKFDDEIGKVLNE